MTPTRRVPGRAVAGVALVIGAIAAPNAPAATAPAAVPAPAGPRLAGRPVTVTLVTGDQVRISTGPEGQRDVGTVPKPGRPDPQLFITRSGGHLSVVPAQALGALSRGLLDPALFDVDRLVAEGLADDRSGTLPVIVDAAGTAAPAAPAGSVGRRKVPKLGMTAVSVRKADAAGFFDAVEGTGRKLWLDGQVHAQLDRSVHQIGADVAQGQGFTGTGVTVAVLDTGIDDEQPDLAGVVADQVNFSADAGTDDHDGHGTHVASIIAGSGAASGGRYRGVAPGARLLDVKVLDANGNGRDSDIVAGMAWAAEHGADVANLSLGGRPSDGRDPLSVALNDLATQHDTLFVVASGNGSGKLTFSPAAADAALAVGAVDRAGILAGFSAGGLRPGDGVMKPELAAPGTEIVAARADGTGIGTSPYPGYVAASGTSMAAPHVAGAAALLRQARPGLTAQELKAVLVATGLPALVVPPQQRQLSVVRADRATAGTLVPDRATLPFGRVGATDGALSQTLSYRNDGPAPVTLTLAAQGASEDGRTLSGLAVSLDVTSQTVAPGKSATVRLSIHPSVLGPGKWTGTLTASSSAAGVELRTPFTLIVQGPGHDLQLDLRGRTGAPATESVIAVYNPDTGELHTGTEYPDPAQPMLHLPAGNWSVAAMIRETAATERGLRAQVSLLTRPNVALAADTTITLDARTAGPVSFEVPDRGLKPLSEQLRYSRAGVDAGFALQYADPQGRSELFAIPAPAAEHGTAAVEFGESSSVPELTGQVLADHQHGDRRLGAGPVPLHPSRWVQDDRLDGRHVIRLGGPGGYRLVATSPAEIEAVAAQAAADGAPGVVAYGEEPLETMMFGPATAVPVVLVPLSEGRLLRDLIARRPVRLALTGEWFSSLRYDLDQTANSIPDPPRFRYRRSDLARIDTVYRSQGDSVDIGSAVRYTSSSGVAGLSPVRAGQRRTDWVTPGTPWTETLDYGLVLIDPPGIRVPWGASWYQLARSYTAGSRTTQTWLDQVMRPATGAGKTGGFGARYGDLLAFPQTLFTDGSNRLGGTRFGDTVSWRLLHGDQVIATGNQPYGFDGTVPPPRQTYTLELTADRARVPSWRRSTFTRTRFTFPSEHVDGSAVLATLSLDPHLPLDDRNTAPAGRPMTFVVDGRMPDELAPVRVQELQVQTSYDGGTTWVPAAQVDRIDDDSFRVRVEHPATPGDVALRIVATAGPELGTDQEIDAAYAIR